VSAPKAPEPFDPSKLFGDTHAPKAEPPAPKAEAPAAKVPAPFAQPPVSTVPRRPAQRKAAPAAPAVEFNFGDTGDLTKCTLRALFATDDDLSAQEIVNLCGELPGLRACLVIAPDGVTSSGQDSSDEEIGHFTANAPRSHEFLTGLAQSMGIEDQGSFTLRSGTTVRTFFIDRGLCLAVLHAQAAFEPGVRDKLIVTLRSLADLLE
jgi:hypothetical protein